MKTQKKTNKNKQKQNKNKQKKPKQTKKVKRGGRQTENFPCVDKCHEKILKNQNKTKFPSKLFKTSQETRGFFHGLLSPKINGAPWVGTQKSERKRKKKRNRVWQNWQRTNKNKITSTYK